MKTKIANLRQAISKASDELLELTGDKEAFEAKETEIKDLEGQLERAITAQQRQAALAKPVDGSPAAEQPLSTVPAAPAGYRSIDVNTPSRDFESYLRAARTELSFAPRADSHFRSLGEQLQAIANHALSRGAKTDTRLLRAPTGASEVDATGGGFLVQTDFARAIFMLAHDMGEILGRVNKVQLSENSNGLKIPAVDETSRATGSRWGGVQSYWVAEGNTVTPSRPKFRLVEFDLKKLMSVMYMTDELLQDTTALTGIAGTAFSEEIMFMTEDAIFEGSGVGLPLGVMNAPAKVAVAKDTAQTADTVTKSNIDNMWGRMWSRSRKNAVWYINQEVEPQLSQLNQPVGTAGGQLVYLPPGGLSASPYATLYGRPIVVTEYNSALGTEGDIMLADFSQYTLTDKNGVQAATSMHVAFLSDEMVFRITYRVDGRPIWSKPIMPFKGTTAKSPFITLATRS